MCGVAGYFGPKLPHEHLLRKAALSIKHRGPDAGGVYTHNHQKGRSVCLIHQRLSVLDLDARSGQPFKFGGLTIVFNGEIYNYLELRNELSGLGYRFSTTGDTEVLAIALRHWGEKALDKFEGMWAFAVYNETAGTLMLCRDRFGEKPLYFYLDNNSIYFASEPKAIATLLESKLQVNINQVKRFLVNGYKSLYKRQETFFEGLKEVKPGHYLQIDEHGNVQQTGFWSPDFTQKENALSFQDSVDHVSELLIQSLRLRLRSDVPTAFCLSGGIDSNVLVAIAQRILGSDVHGFTIVNTDKRYEENDLVKLSVNSLGLRHTEININPSNFLTELRTLIRNHEAPIYTINYFAQWQMMKEVRAQGIKVTFSGTGADEIFSGYYDHHLAYLAVMKRDHPDLYCSSLINWATKIKPFVRNPFLTDPNYFVEDHSRRSHIYLDSEEFSRMLFDSFSETFEEADFGVDLLRNRMLNELFYESVPVILHEDDLNSMFYGIENRSPYLDRQLFEFSQTIPTRYLVNDGLAKTILREVGRGIVPSPILDNPRKVGFNIPIYDYLKRDSKSNLEEIFSDSPIFQLVKRESIQNILKRESLSNSQSKFLFNFISCKIFLEEFGV